MMLDTNKIQVILFEFKMDHKAVETTHNMNSAFGPGTADERTVQGWFKTFCQGDKALKMRSVVAGQEVDDDQWRAIIKAGPLTST